MAKPAATLVQEATDYASHAPYVALGSNAASTTAPTEPSGGSPAYARVASNWGTPNAGTGVDVASPAAINVPSGFTVLSVYFMSASTAGTVWDSAAVTSQAFASQGTYQPTITNTPS